MPIKRIPLMLLPLAATQTTGSRFRGIGIKVLNFYPSVRYDLRMIGVDALPEHYCAIAFISAAIWAVMLTAFIAIALTFSPLPAPAKMLFPILAFVVVLMLFLLLHLYYPKMMARSIAAKIDRELIFVMRDMLIQISSGIPFFNVVENVGNANYDYASAEFKSVANRVKAGGALIDELERMAIHTNSEYLKRTSWQLVTAMRSGANMTTTLRGIVKVLVDYQFSLSKSFNAELNFIVLIYLMLSAVLPTIGTTVMVIFSVFGLLGVTPEVMAGVVGVSFVGQMAVIGYVKMKRPGLFSS